LFKLIYCLLYGDFLMRLLLRVRPYEASPGSAQKLYEKWDRFICAQLYKKVNYRRFKKTIRAVLKEFDALPLRDVKKSRVGLVGEIMVKFSPFGNNNAVALVEAEGCEAVMPDMMDFFLYCFDNAYSRRKLLDGGLWPYLKSQIYIRAVEHFRKPMRKALRKSTKFGQLSRIKHLRELAGKAVSVGNMSGEGWFLTAEIMELLESGVHNIICMQPFACLPNHVTGKGIIKELRRLSPKSNIVPIDYDPGASEVNQINRIKLMLSAAEEKKD
jgi:predicted nucleotide-binding protein (sugar kinase/HSP70/actin superfamily)